jgi:serine/threonine protein kinase
VQGEAVITEEMIGKTLGRYEIKRELGRGAMGVVYLAHDPLINREVAIKTILLRPGDKPKKRKEHMERFQREFQIAGQLSRHPNIVSILDVIEQDSNFFVVMDYIEGTSLRHVMVERKHLSIEETLEVAIGIGAALDEIHKHDVVHRDVKPGNIMIDENGMPLLTDFGIVRVHDSELTASGGFIGSPSYMSPEQVQGLRVDWRSDLFSYGVCIYAMLAGAKPFSASSISAITHKIVNEEPQAVSQVHPDYNVPQNLDAVMAKVLAKKLDDRYQSAYAFLEAFEEAIEASEKTRSRTARAFETKPPGDWTETEAKNNMAAPQMKPPGTEPTSEASSQSRRQRYRSPSLRMDNAGETSQIEEYFAQLSHQKKSQRLFRVDDPRDQGGEWLWTGAAILFVIIMLGMIIKMIFF